MGAYHRNIYSLNGTEKSNLFINNINSDTPVFPKLKSGSETGTSECEKIFNGGMARLNALSSAKFLTCTCMLVEPIAACLCYGIIIAEHYLAVEKLVNEKEQCEKNS